MMGPSGKGQVATRGGWTSGGNGGGEGKRSNRLMDGQVAALGLQTPTVEQVFWSKDNVMVHSQVGKLILLEVMSLQVQALGLQVFPQEAPTMQ